MELTEEEKKVIGVLVACEAQRDAYGAPIHEVDRMMKWPTTKSLKFVVDLVEREIIWAITLDARGESIHPLKRWELVPE